MFRWIGYREKIRQFSGERSIKHVINDCRELSSHPDCDHVVTHLANFGSTFFNRFSNVEKFLRRFG